MVWPIMAGKGLFATHVRLGQEASQRKGLFQLLVFRSRSDEDGNIWVGVFPEREGILIRGAGFGGVALQDIGPSERLQRQI
jgi:hypothetical protein